MPPFQIENLVEWGMPQLFEGNLHIMNITHIIVNG